MSDSDKPSRVKKFLKVFFVIIPIILMVFGGVMIGALKLVERYPDPLKEGFEKFLSERSHTNATIGILEKVTFFPVMEIQLRNLTLHNRDNAAIIELEAEWIEIDVPFWSVFLGTGKIYDLQVENLKAQAGLLSPKALYIEDLRIVDKAGAEESSPQYGSFFVVDGTYADKKMSFEAKLDKLEKGYSIPEEIQFFLRVGSAELNASMVKGYSEVNLNNLVFSQGKKTSLARDYKLIGSKKHNEDNPLDCMLEHADGEECERYLEEEIKEKSVQ